MVRPGVAARDALIDVEGHAHAGYRAAGDRTTLVLVRPDGYLGYLGYDPDDLAAYLARFGF
nr:hypothetical protein [Actinocatenispora thailandica]